MAILNTPFVQVALPIMVTLVLAAWLDNNATGKRIDDLGKRIDDLGKRIDDLKGDMNRRFDDVNRRFDKLEALAPQRPCS